MTVRDLLSNDSGRQWSTQIDYGQLLRARDRTAFAVGLKQADPPGTVWAQDPSGGSRGRAWPDAGVLGTPRAATWTK